jgi:glucan 1,3-beta-glucosidase
LINPIAVDENGNTKLGSAATVDVWVWGNAVPGNYMTGQTYTTSPSSVLLSGGKYFAKAQPTYGEYAVDQIVNVKSVSGFPVKGDAVTDDSTSLNAILSQNAAACKISYFPYGVYVVENTLVIPPGSRIVGEGWPVIMGVGSNFNSAQNPTPVVQVGAPGSSGVAEIQDMRFTVGSVLPGAIIVQVNMAGNPGDVGFWNSHITVGGTAESSVNSDCSNGDASGCMAAFAMLHLAPTSSAYVENMWGWTADHSLDGGPQQRIATGRGLLVEATKGTWLSGTAFEHNWLYQYNIFNAQNVFAGMQQTETAYFQGASAVQAVPAPWIANATYGDPDYSWCAGGANSCRMGLAQNIDGGSEIRLYNGAHWAFFHGPWDNNYSATDEWRCGANCETNMVRVANNPTSFTWYGIDTSVSETMVMDTVSNPLEYNNPGGWNPYGGQIAAYLSYA